MFWISTAAVSCWPGMYDPAGQLCRISGELGRLGTMGICLSFMSAWGMGILEALALLRALFMVQTFLLMKPFDWG